MKNGIVCRDLGKLALVANRDLLEADRPLGATLGGPVERGLPW